MPSILCVLSDAYEYDIQLQWARTNSYTNTTQMDNVSHSNFAMSSCCFICLQQIKQQPGTTGTRTQKLAPSSQIVTPSVRKQQSLYNNLLVCRATRYKINTL